MKRVMPVNRQSFSFLLMLMGALLIISSVALARTESLRTAAPSDGSLVKIDLWGEVKRGDETVRLDNNMNVRPGEEIIWKVQVANRRQSWIAGVQAIGDIPHGTQFVPNSATGDGLTAVEYSIDGGSTFSAQPMTMRDGRLVPAPVSAYTQIRLTFGARIESGAMKTASYRTRVL